MITFIIIFFCAIIVGWYLYTRHVYMYWKRRGVDYLEPSFPFGNVGDLIMMKRDFGRLFQDFHESIKGDMIGFYMCTRPALIIKDPELLKKILIKDFDHFADRGFYIDAKKDPCSATLFSISGQEWRTMRNKMSPAFTSGKLKMIYNTVAESGKNLERYLDKIVAEGVEEIEARDISARFLTDLIASVAFGLEVDSLNEPDTMFRKMGSKVFKSIFGILVSFMMPSLLKIVFLRQTPIDVQNFFLSAVQQNLEYREKNNITREDFFQIMIQLRNGIDVSRSDINAATEIKGDGVKRMSLEEITAQCFIFFAAGFDSSSSVISFCMYELAKHPHILREVQEQIDAVLNAHGGKLTYDSIAKITKLDNCIDETQRLYPPGPNLFRICTKNYKIPDTEIIIEKGTNIFVSVLGIHRDPNIYPNPTKFDPSRFDPTQKSQRSPMDYMPFGDGPRNCVGMRLAKMNTKMGMISLLSKFDFRLGTGMKDELIMDPKNILAFPLGGIRLKISKRKNL